MSVALFAALAVIALAVPVRADETATASAARAAQAKRSTASFGTVQPAIGTTPARTGYANGFLYFSGSQPGVNIGGRVPVGKSHVYVPYYGTISNDPAHPGVQGTAGLAYGFRTWDISVLNGGVGPPGQTVLPGTDAPKVNPSLSLSIRF